MVRHFVLTLVVVLAASRAASADGPAKTVQRLAPPLSFDRLGNADGLPNTTVHAIAQDARGFIWLGTQEGLARYDGTAMRVYRSNDNDLTSLSAGYITALTVDVSGKLWVGTAENGVNLYDPDTDTFMRFAKGAKGGLSSEGVTSIVRDSKDRMWFAMSGGGLNRFDPATSTFTPYQTAPLDVAITALHADPKGPLWLGTAEQDVIQWNPEDGTSVTFQPPSDSERGVRVTSLLAASTGTVWVGTDGDGLFAFDPKTKKFVRHLRDALNPATISDDHTTCLFEDRAKNLWIGTTNGLNRMDPSGVIFQYHHDPNAPTSIGSPGIETIFQDTGGVIWIGGLVNGLSKFDELRLKFGHHRTLTHVTNSFFEDPDGTLWVGTYTGGLYKYEHAAQRVTLYHSLGVPNQPGSIALASAWIAALHRDRRGTMWIASKGQGLIALDTKTDAIKQYLPDPDVATSLPVDTIWDISEDDQGMLWLATWGGGLVRFDPTTETFKAVTAEDGIGLTSNHLYTLYRDPKESSILWIGTAKGGLVRFDTVAATATSIRHTEDRASLSSDDVLTVYRDPAGMLWVGTYGGGFNRIDPATGTVQRFTTSTSKLTNNVVLGILPDDEGKLWLSTNGGGLIQFDPKANTFLVYDRSDGVQDNEFGQGSSMRSKSGKLYFGGVSGFNAFFPKDLKRDTYVPPVVMTDFKVFNQAMKLPRPIWTLPSLGLSYSDSFELRFAALSFAAPSKNRYAYKLEGFDDEFIETDRPYATYTKLDGGNYTLRVRASNRHGAWNETGIALKLAVTPPLYRTWPAFALYILVIGVAVFLFFRYQREKVRRAEREGRLAVVERDLQLTGAVQSGFLPEDSEINGEHVRLFGFYKAADACSGDWWWHEMLPDGRHVVLVGDVTGHGPGPAMVTAAVATAFRVLTGNGLLDMSQGLELLNRVVLHVAKGQYSMTMAVLELDEVTGRWVLHSAGAPPILSLDHTGKHKVHFCPGTPLGTAAGFETGRVDGQLEPSGRILMYTDGIPEITLPNGKELGMRRFAQTYERTRGQRLRDAAGALVELAAQSQGNKPQADDWTFTLVEYGGLQGQSEPPVVAPR